jgi:hypothetical protein
MPLDLALGWAKMGTPEVQNDFFISQSQNHYYWTALTKNYTFDEASQESANVHCVPSNDLLKSQLCHLHTGQIVKLEGYLIQIKGGNLQGPLTSSLTRTDTGDGACEILWVEALQTK